tara:strand:- start:52 stop:6540 length:6489 start_codon:yes stop_codon:yes gene_type:complete
MEEYIINGETFSKDTLQIVADRKGITFDQLLQDNTNIQAKTSPVNQSAFAEPGIALNTGYTSGDSFSESQEDDTWLERQFGKNWFTDFFGDMWRSGEQGWAQSQSVGENIQLFNKGVDASEADIMAFIRENQKAKSLGISDEMRDFQRIYKEEGEGIWGFIKGVLHNPSVIPQVFTSSMTTLAGSVFDADEVAASGTAGLVGGAAIGASVSGGLLAIPGGIAGLFGGVAGAMETGLTLGELMQEELRKEGKEFTKNNVKDFIADEEKWNRLKRRAVGRGISIGAIEAIGGGIAGRVGGRLYTGTKLVKEGGEWTTKAITKAGTEVKVGARKIAGLGASIGIESLAGATGEIVGRTMADQEMDVAEIGFEAIAGTATAPINLAAAVLTSPSYKIHGKKVSKEDIRNQLKGDPIDILNANIEIKNDPAFELEYNRKRSEAVIKGKVLLAGGNFLNTEEVDEVVKLEREILDAENKDLNKTETGKLLISEKRAKIKEINEKAQERGEQNEETTEDFLKALLTSIGQKQKEKQKQREKNKKLFEKDKNFIEKVFTVFGKKTTVDWLEVSNTDELKSALLKMGEPEEMLTPEYLEREFNKGGMYRGGVFIVNTETAKSDQPFAPSHEFTHGLVDHFVEDIPKIVTGIQDIIGIEQTNAVHEYMRGRNRKVFNEDGTPNIYFKEGETIPKNELKNGKQKKVGDISNDKQYAYNQEFLAYYGQALKDVDSGIKLSDNILTKIGEFITKYILRPLGFKTAGFETPAQVNEFLKAAAREDVATTKKAIEKAKQVRSPYKGGPPRSSQPKIDQQKLNTQVDKLVGPKDEDGNYTMTKAEWDSRGIEKAYNSIIQGNLLDGLIRTQFKDPETKTLLENVYGRTIKEATEAVKTGVPGKTSLTETLMKFNPEENNSLIGWINKQLAFRVGDVTNYFKDRPKATGQAQEAFEKTSKETPVETTDTDIAYTPKARTVINEKDITAIPVLVDLITGTDNIIDYYANIKEKTIDLSDNELSEMNYANVKDMVPSITKKMFGDTSEARMKFIRDNAKTLHELLPNAAMTRAAGEKGLKSSTKIVNSVLKNFYTKEEATEETTGRGKVTRSGLPVQNKNKFNQKIYDDLFGTDPSIGLRNQKETLLPGFISEIGRAFTNSVLRAELTSREVDPNVIHVLGDGKSEILASQSYMYDIDNVEHKTQDAINSLMGGKKFGDSKIDPKPKTITKTKDIEKQMYEAFIKKYPRYKSGDGKVVKFELKHFRQYVEEYNGRKTFLIKNPDWTSPDDIKGPSKQGDADFIFKLRNLDPKFEHKSKKSDRHGSISLRLIDGKLTWNNKVLPEAQYGNVLEKINKLFLPKLKKYLKQSKASVSDRGAIRVDKEKHNIVRDKGLLPNAYIKLDNLDIIIEHNEGADFLIHAKEDNVYKLNNRIKNNVTPLKGIMQLEVRIKRSGDHATIGIDFRILNIEKSNTKWSTFNASEILSSEPLNLDKEFNIILEETKGVARDKVVGDIDALLLGKKKDRPKILPYSAEDLEGLIYHFLGKGKQGDRHFEFFNDHLFKPLTEAQMTWDAAKLKADNQWKDIRTAIRKSGIDLGGQVKSKLEPNLEKYTNEQVIRAAMWIAKGTPVDGVDVKEAASIMRYVRTELDFTDFMEQMYNIFPDKMYPTPLKVDAKNWLSGTILTDVLDSFNNKNTRAIYFKEFWDNVEQIFGKLSKDKLTGPNINKIKSLYGENFLDSLGNILYRIKTGRNREYGTDRITNGFMNWTNDAVGTIMFFNTRSALLQMISFANFINWTDNNAMAATARFMDQKQYWNDFAMIFNSDFLKSRRKGLRTDVNADEIASAASKATNKFRAVLSTILKLGFLPTQIADSMAISIGGASFYRNRVNSLMKNGMSKKKAEEQAFRDFQQSATASQQSALPWRISKQQAGPLGRVILAFQNTPMQYTRLIKKAVMDLKNGRGDFKSNLSKITYYMAIQNIIFHGLQSAMFALMFADTDEEDRKKAYQNLGNRMADTLLVGTGVYGAIAATTKNVILEVIAQEKSGRRDFEKAAIKSTALSPPISSKLQKLLRASRRFQYKQERAKIQEMGLTTQNPAVISAGEILSAVFNLPADRAIRKWNNLVKAADSETELWQSIALSLGYSEWDVRLMESQNPPKMNIKRREYKKREYKKREYKKD